jgi:hypothetical protein
MVYGYMDLTCRMRPAVRCQWLEESKEAAGSDVVERTDGWTAIICGEFRMGAMDTSQ